MRYDQPFGGIVPGPRGDVLAALMRTDAPLTGRQVHGLLDDRVSLWSVQQALAELAHLGLTTVETIGRAGVHRVNEDHVGVAHLRPLLSPLDLLSQVVREAVGDDVTAVLVFGSVARGQSDADSDVDLAVVAPATWSRRLEVEDAVRARLGNACDVLHLSQDALLAPPEEREPVVGEVLRDGLVLLGSLPRRSHRAAS